MDVHALLLNAATLHREGRLNEACALYRRILALRPDLADASLFLGLASLQLGRPADAEAAFARAAALRPQDAEARHGLGATRLALGRPQEAEADQRRALELAPDAATPWDGLGSALLAQDRIDEALAAYAHALELAGDGPDRANILANLGVASKRAGRPAEALAYADRSLALRPGDPDTLCNRANAALDLGDAAAARRDFEAACVAAPEHVTARWGACFASLPVAFDAEADIAPARAAYAEALGALDAWLGDDPQRLRRTADLAAGTLQPFYLTYQGRNDRALQARYGALLARVMAARHPDLAMPPPPRRRDPNDRDDRLRVGVCTAFFHEHSVWKIPTRGWLTGLDRSRFHVTGLCCGARRDACTEEARARCDDFVFEPWDLERLVRAARERELDAVLFPEVGMDPLTARAAALRLAPVQAVGLGHPMTTGLPTVDFFLSCDAMEPATGAQDWYTERLVRLPGTSLWYEPLRHDPPPLTRADFGLPEDAVLCFSPQSLFKYLPQHDGFFPAVARAAEAEPGGARCVFVFVEHRRAARLTERFRARLKRAFAAAGLAPDRHMVLLPHQPPDRYRALAGCCDLFLDSLGWSGFNTAMEAAEAGLPLLTCPGECLRARHALAVVRALGLDDAVAATPTDYVALAARLIRDADRRAELAARVRAAAPRLWRDPAPIRALEAWLETAVAESRGGR